MPFYVSMGRPSLSSLSMNSSPYRYVSPDGGSVWKGPRKICCFCTLAIVFPALLISIPLLMRFVLYGTSSHFLNPSDMKILDNRISTTWCQGETVRINTSFTAYVTDGEPSLIDEPAHLTLDRNLIIPDDHKEYWGFYLLKGSKFKIRTCARWRGGTLLVVQGENHLEHCAYIGESDSAGNSDEVSSSNSFELNNELMKPNKLKTYSQEELDTILTKIRYYIKANPKNYGVLKKHLAEWLLIEQEAYEKRKTDGDYGNFSTNSPLENLKSILDENEPSSLFPTSSPTSLQNILASSSGFQETDNGTILGISHKNYSETLNGNSSSFPLALLVNSVETGTLKRGRREAEIRRKTESGENGAFEDESVDDQNGDSIDSLSGVVHPRMKYLTSAKPKSFDWPTDQGHHTGVLNDTFGDNKDGSDSESESSFSSSEEALKRCEGVLATFNIVRDDNCEAFGSYDDLDIYFEPSNALHVAGSADEFLPYYEDIVNVSGYYYFIFGSENEKRDNFIRAKFELEKSEYHLPEPLQNCTNVKECHVDFKFASSQKVVVKIPRPPPQFGAYWDQVYVAETECHPRTHLYMIFAFMVPLVILLCAFQ